MLPAATMTWHAITGKAHESSTAGRAATDTVCPPGQLLHVPPSAPAPFRVRGLALALCCHHACQQRGYVADAWLRARGIGVAHDDFARLTRLAAPLLVDSRVQRKSSSY